MVRRCATTLEAEMTPAEHQLLCRILREQCGQGLHLEIGTAAGGTLCAMLGAFGSDDRPPFVVVDPMSYFPEQLATVRTNLERHELDDARIDFRVARSHDAFQEADKRKEVYDFMLIDGCHKIRSVTTDLKWTRLLAVGGTVAFHDFTPTHRGVWLAVKRFLSCHRNYEIVDQADSLLVVRKVAASSTLEVSRADERYALLMYLPLQLERKWARWTRPAKPIRRDIDTRDTLESSAVSDLQATSGLEETSPRRAA